MLAPRERWKKGTWGCSVGVGRGFPGRVWSDAQKVSEYRGSPCPEGPSPGVACLLQLASFSCRSDFSHLLGWTWLFFFFLWPHCEACKILVPGPGIECGPQEWKPGILVNKTLLRVPQTTRRSNQSILKEINPDCSLEGLMLKLPIF